MIFRFVLFMVLFLGGFVLLGIAHELADFQALVFCGGLALVCIAMALMMREGRSGATRRSNNWDGGPSTN